MLFLCHNFDMSWLMKGGAKDSRLNRNFAVCGSQGSMKSIAFARNMILQRVKRRERMFITNPKSELYEDTAHYLEQNGYLVKQYNLIHHDCSDTWDCLEEIDGSGITEDQGDISGELIDVEYLDCKYINTLVLKRTIRPI